MKNHTSIAASDLQTMPARNRTNVIAIILAAGLGRRMRPLTDQTHKTLLEIGGQTVLARIVDSLVVNNVSDIVVVTGYRAHEVEAHLRAEYPQIAFQFIENDRYAETNNIYSMALAFEQVDIDRDVLLIESDLVCTPEIIARIVRSPHANVALVDRYHSGQDGTVVLVRDGIVTDVIPTHLQQAGFSFADKYKTLNIYRFSREFCTSAFRKLLTWYARVIDDNCYYELILGIMIYMRQAVIAAEILDGEPWMEIDDPNDLRVARFLFEPQSRGEILDETRGGYWAFDVLDFSYLRNMHFPTPAMLAAIRDATPALIHNYGSSQRILNEKLSYLLLCEQSRIQTLNGASQLFPWLRRHFAGKRALLPAITFGEWPAAFPAHQQYADRPGVDVTEIEERANEADVVVFVNPNNPTGTELDAHWLWSFAKDRPDKTIIVDESFQGFSGTQSVREYLDEDPLPNVLVVVSMSKTLGIPGVRLGYAYTCDPKLCAAIGTEVPIWNLNSVAEHILELTLKHRDSLTDSFVKSASDKLHFASSLAENPAVEHVYRGGGNFLLVALSKTSDPGNSVAETLLRDCAILVKDVSARFSDGRTWLRIAVRLPDENERFCVALEKAIAKEIAE